MKSARIITIGIFCAITQVNLAFADIAPPPGYVEQCTVAKQQKAGQECRACGSSFMGRKECAKLGAQGFKEQCRSQGASVWTEVWCRPAGAKSPRQTSPMR